MDLSVGLKIQLDRITEGIPASQLLKSVKTLSARYRGLSGQDCGRSNTEARIITTDIEALAYALVRMPATYAAVTTALKHIAELDVNFAPGSLLDIGAGTGAATWAADSAFSLQTVICVEREEVMRDLGARLMSAGSQALRSAKWIGRDLRDIRDTRDIIDQRDPDESRVTNDETALPNADLVIASYVLSEIPESARFSLIEALWNITNDTLLIVEPGTPVCFARVLEIRDLLLSKGAYIVAPCARANPCPLSGGDWCHFACRVARSKTHRYLKSGDVPYEDEKFTYMAFSKRSERRARARVLRHPIINEGHITLKLCSEEGFRESRITKSQKELYKKARKAKWGDALVL